MGMLLDHVVRGGERQFLGKVRLNTVLFAHSLLGVVQSFVNSKDGRLEILNIAIGLLDVLLPIELIDVQRVRVVHVVIASQSAEVGDDSLTGLDLVVVEGPSLPLGEAEGYLEVYSGEVAGFEGGGTFGSVEVIVEAGGAGDEERGGDANEVDVGLEVGFEGGLAEEEGFFELETVGEDRCVAAVEAVFRRESSKRIVAVEGASHDEYCSR
mmetsp:Transcript_34976/g.73777  ORF Transcript_34976/g.73777 Transcript_34976/m.73777 type:complete len:211 (+) Transcript_34976:642-1274(+)